MQDEQIIKLFYARDERAISETSSKYGGYCTSIAYNILQNLQDSEECVNDTWLGAWNSIPPANPSVLQTYLGKITRNLALDRWRRCHTDKRGGGRIAVALDEVHEIISSGYSVSDEYLQAEFLRTLNLFLRALPDRERNIFIRRYYFADDIPDIAKRFGTTQNNTLKILCRTRQKLKNYLDKEWHSI
jgi:RNA polymerase sigma-70 factor (ECF subfamily)